MRCKCERKQQLWDGSGRRNDHKTLIAEGGIKGCRAGLEGGGVDAGQTRERVGKGWTFMEGKMEGERKNVVSKPEECGK
jgi:hypothetical protein